MWDARAICGAVFVDHVRRWREHNHDLVALPRSRDLEFWFHEFPVDLLPAAEKQLIRSLHPANNKIRYKHVYEN